MPVDDIVYFRDKPISTLVRAQVLSALRTAVAFREGGWSCLAFFPLLRYNIHYE